MEGVDPDRDTETFAEVLLEIDTLRWRGTRFVMRAGKALASRRKGILVHDHHPDGEPVSDEFTGTQDRLWIGIDGPNTIRLGLMGSTLGPPAENEPLVMEAPVPAAALPPTATSWPTFCPVAGRIRCSATRPWKRGGSSNRSSTSGTTTKRRWPPTRPDPMSPRRDPDPL